MNKNKLIKKTKKEINDLKWRIKFAEIQLKRVKGFQGYKGN
jgi:hypothetical protein